jgi:hypothetical protein
MRKKFVRIYERKLLSELLAELDSNLESSNFTLGLPKPNINPLTITKGNTVVSLYPRNPFSAFGKFTAYYNRPNLKDISSLIKTLPITTETHLYEVLDNLNKNSGLNFTENDLYNTSIKEFPDGKLYLVLLARPESYKFRGKLDVEILQQSKVKQVILKPTVLELGKPYTVSLNPTVLDFSKPESLTLKATIMER